MKNGSQIFCEHDFVKGSRSNADGSGDCVGVARLSGVVSIRDDKQAFGSPMDFHLTFTTEQFDRIQAGIRRPDFTGLDLVIELDALVVEFDAITQMYAMRSAVPQPGLPEGVALKFTESEMRVFYAAVQDFEFERDTVMAA